MASTTGVFLFLIFYFLFPFFSFFLPSRFWRCVEHQLWQILVLSQIFRKEARVRAWSCCCRISPLSLSSFFYRDPPFFVATHYAGLIGDRRGNADLFLPFLSCMCMWSVWILYGVVLFPKYFSGILRPFFPR